MATLRKMPTQAVPLVDLNTGLMTPEWFLYFRSREQVELANLVDVSTTAPTNGQALLWNSTPGTN